MTPVTIFYPVAIVFEQDGGTLRAKPFPSYPDFTDIYLGASAEDLEAISASLSDTNDIAVAAYESAAIAESQAGTAITDAATAYSLAETASIDAANAQSTANDALYLVGVAASKLPDNVLLLPLNFRTITNGFGAPVLQAGQFLGQYQTLAGNGDRAIAVLALGDNNYDLEIGYIKGSSLGDLDIIIDSGTPITVHQYNATTLLSQRAVFSLGSLVGGSHVLELTVSGKSTSSSGFNCLVSYIAIRQSP